MGHLAQAWAKCLMNHIKQAHKGSTLCEQLCDHGAVRQLRLISDGSMPNSRLNTSRKWAI